LKTRLQGKKDVDDAVKKTEIVLFGLGDLRVRDHEGLSKALKNVAVDTNVLPLFAGYSVSSKFSWCFDIY